MRKVTSPLPPGQCCSEKVHFQPTDTTLRGGGGRGKSKRGDFQRKSAGVPTLLSRIVAKNEYYTDLFTEINDCKPYWQLVQNAAGSRSAQPILEASEDRMAGLKLRTRIKRKFSTRTSLPLGRSSPMNSQRIVPPISLVSHQRLRKWS